jgi:pimeloyl-ACP methyl ester carboxylesterase
MSYPTKFTVVAWDAPGFGRSSDPPETFRLPDYADCLAAFVDALGLELPHVLGLSFGGGLALELYRRKPALPRTLVLASAYAGWAGSLPTQVVAERLESRLRAAKLPPDRFVPDTASWPAPSPRPICETSCRASRLRLCSSTGTPTSALLCS